MRDTFELIIVIALANSVTALGTVWLVLKAGRVSTALTNSGLAARAVTEQSHEAFIDALARIELEVAAQKVAAAHTASRIDIATELGYQNAEAAFRMEGHDADVAQDLAESISRADANADPSPGASADAALRSGVTAAEIREEQAATPTEEPNV